MGQEQIMTVQTVQKIRKDFKKMVDKIHKAQATGNMSMLDIAHALTVLSSEDFEAILKENSCNNIADYAELEFGIGKTSTYDSIKVFSAFGDVATGKLLPAFAEYTFSQLKVIAPAVLEDKNGYILLPACNDCETEAEYVAAIKEQFPADMKVRDIQKAVKELRNKDKQKIEDIQKSESEHFEINQEESTCAESDTDSNEDVDSISQETTTALIEKIAIDVNPYRFWLKVVDQHTAHVMGGISLSDIDSTYLATLFHSIAQYIDITNFTFSYVLHPEMEKQGGNTNGVSE